MESRALILLAIALTLTGCQTGHPADQNASTAPVSQSAKQSAGAPAALVEGQPIDWQALRPFLVEAGGGQALVELVVGRLVDQKLASRGLTLTDQLLEAERASFLAGLSNDPNDAQRLLDEVRARRGLGRFRYPQMIRRNASLRLLVQDDVKVTEPAIREAYDYRYGPRFEARLIVTNGLAAAGEVVRKARQGEPFIDLAVQYSTDSSRAQGGLIPQVSAVDPTFPQAVRTALGKLQPGQISDPVALDGNFAVLKLERIIPAQNVKLDDVRGELEIGVRRQVEQMLMQQLLRTMLRQAQVIVMDSDLQQRWDYQRQLLLGGAEE